tara:strand:- start:1373 stop:1597 length:225 start_codon:yes stop_codon:yes gene_type:complete
MENNMSVAKRLSRKVYRKYNDIVSPEGDTHKKLLKSSEKAGDHLMKAGDAAAKGILQLALIFIVPLVLMYLLNL